MSSDYPGAQPRLPEGIPNEAHKLQIGEVMSVEYYGGTAPGTFRPLQLRKKKTYAVGTQGKPGKAELLELIRAKAAKGLDSDFRGDVPELQSGGTLEEERRFAGYAHVEHEITVGEGENTSKGKISHCGNPNTGSVGWKSRHSRVA